VKRLASAGRFATAVSCDDDEIKDYGFPGIYAHQAEVSGCSVFWSPKAGSR
jgi:hypothetical protein